MLVCNFLKDKLTFKFQEEIAMLYKTRKYKIITCFIRPFNTYKF
jgi:hypothetical protein